MKALIIQPMKKEGPGLLGTVLLEKGWDLDIRCVEEGAPLPENLDGCQAMVILGGPMGAYQEDLHPFLTEVQKLIRLAGHKGIPTLGICLGAQLIARALGAEVKPNPHKEIGWYTLDIVGKGKGSSLFKGIESPVVLFQWHQDTFAMPPGAELCASSELCAHQAFNCGGIFWGLQFHPEITPHMVKDWVAGGEEDLIGLPFEDPAASILQETDRIWKQASQTGRILSNNIEEILRRRSSFPG